MEVKEPQGDCKRKLKGLRKMLLNTGEKKTLVI
jgi:hypothetical protein